MKAKLFLAAALLSSGAASAAPLSATAPDESVLINQALNRAPVTVSHSGPRLPAIAQDAAVRLRGFVKPPRIDRSKLTAEAQGMPAIAQDDSLSYEASLRRLQRDDRLVAQD